MALHCIALALQPCRFVCSIVSTNILYLHRRPVSEFVLLWQPSNCIVLFVIIMFCYLENKYDDDDDDDLAVICCISVS